jgi:hypothetical protein
MGLLDKSQKISELIRVAMESAREMLDQFDFPIRPTLEYEKVKNVKSAGNSDQVLSGTVVLLCKCATMMGTKQSFEIPVSVKAGTVVPPAVINYQGSDYVLAQSTVNAIVQRASFYELMPIRNMFDPPQDREERAMVTETRNQLGYQAREGGGPVSVRRRDSKRAQEENKDAEEIYEMMINDEGSYVEAVRLASEFDGHNIKDITMDFYEAFGPSYNLSRYDWEDVARMFIEYDVEKSAKRASKTILITAPSGREVHWYEKYEDEYAASYLDYNLHLEYRKDFNGWYGYETTDTIPWSKINSELSSDQSEDAMTWATEEFENWRKNRKIASMGTAVPAGYEKCKELMDKAEEEGLDTFPRSWIHVLRNYILELVSTASQDQWMTHLVNDGYVLNPYGTNRGRGKTAQAEDVEEDVDEEDEMEEEVDVENEDNEVEEEGEEDTERDEEASLLYEGTKTPIEIGDSIKFEGKEDTIRGTIVEIDQELNKVIVKSKGFEYRVEIDDIKPLNKTFKKMYSNKIIQLAPPGKIGAELLEENMKNPNIDDPWGAAWEAYNTDLHSGPKDEGKNKQLTGHKKALYEEDPKAHLSLTENGHWLVVVNGQQLNSEGSASAQSRGAAEKFFISQASSWAKEKGISLPLPVWYSVRGEFISVEEADEEAEKLQNSVI